MVVLFIVVVAIVSTCFATLTMGFKRKAATASSASLRKARAVGKELLGNIEGNDIEGRDDNNASSGMFLRSRAEADAMAAEKEKLSRKRAAAGALGAAGFKAALARGEGKQPTIPLRKKGHFVDKH